MNLTGEWANTLGGEQFVLAESGADDKIIILGTRSNLHHLAEAESIFVDGTFSTCPRQIFSIHIIKVPYGVCTTSQQAARYIQPHVHDGQRGSTQSWS